MNIKFCGIRRKEDVQFCNRLQPEYMGMILSSGFRRTISIEVAAKLLQEKHGGIQAVGVFVNETTARILEIVQALSLQVIQLHGAETAVQIAQLHEKTGLPVWKAVRVKDQIDLQRAQQLGADHLILEGYVPGQVGGTGVLANWEILAKNRPVQSFFLAGGLTPENVADAIQQVQPAGVDVSSGIETDGVKDFEKMQQIVQVIRGE